MLLVLGGGLLTSYRWASGGFRLRPGAVGFPARGDASFAALTLASTTAFGTAKSRFMPRLKLANSGVDSKRSRLNGGGCIDPALASLLVRPSAMSHLNFTRELRISQPASDDLAHPDHKAVYIVRAPIVESECLLVNVPKQVEGFDRNVRAV